MIRLGKRVIVRMSDAEYAELMEMRGHMFGCWSVTELLRKAINLLKREHVRQKEAELERRVMGKAPQHIMRIERPVEVPSSSDKSAEVPSSSDKSAEVPSSSDKSIPTSDSNIPIGSICELHGGPTVSDKKAKGRKRKARQTTPALSDGRSQRQTPEKKKGKGKRA